MIPFIRRHGTSQLIGLTIMAVLVLCWYAPQVQ